MGKMDKLNIGDIEELAEVPGKIEEVRITAKGKVVGLVYSNDSKYVTYNKSDGFGEVSATKVNMKDSAETGG